MKLEKLKKRQIELNLHINIIGKKLADLVLYQKIERAVTNNPTIQLDVRCYGIDFAPIKRYW